MAQVVIPVSPVSTLPRMQINVHLHAEILSPDAARRQANLWLLENVGNLLRAEDPELIAGELLIWRLNVMLTSPQRGTVGQVGRLEVEATTGNVMASDALAQEMLDHAQTLADN
jgi:hypothetical protein